jgi:hypothetical protein
MEDWETIKKASRALSDKSGAAVLDDLFADWLKRGPDAMASLLQQSATEFVLALDEAIHREREGHTLQ